MRFDRKEDIFYLHFNEGKHVNKGSSLLLTHTNTALEHKRSIVDHIFPLAYNNGVEKVTERNVLSSWIHFPISETFISLLV